MAGALSNQVLQAAKGKEPLLKWFCKRSWLWGSLMSKPLPLARVSHVALCSALMYQQALMMDGIWSKGNTRFALGVDVFSAVLTPQSSAALCQTCRAIQDYITSCCNGGYWLTTVYHMVIVMFCIIYNIPARVPGRNKLV